MGHHFDVDLKYILSLIYDLIFLLRCLIWEISFLVRCFTFKQQETSAFLFGEIFYPINNISHHVYWSHKTLFVSIQQLRIRDGTFGTLGWWLAHSLLLSTQIITSQFRTSVETPLVVLNGDSMYWSVVDKKPFIVLCKNHC